MEDKRIELIKKNIGRKIILEDERKAVIAGYNNDLFCAIVKVDNDGWKRKDKDDIIIINYKEGIDTFSYCSIYYTTAILLNIPSSD